MRKEISVRQLFPLFLVLWLTLTPLGVLAENKINAEKPQSTETTKPPSQEKAVPAKEGHGVAHKLLLYIPNRVFDVLDVARVRLRLGPGLGLGVRVTKIASLYLGSYASAYIGLRGPRLHPEIPWPFGADTNSGVQISVINETTDEPEEKGAPAYGLLEIGADGQLILFGAALGVDPLEVVDFVTGIFLVDLTGDDL